MQVEKVQVVSMQLDVLSILVVASGLTPTTHWSHFELNPLFMIDPPDDGIWDIEFDGQPPDSHFGRMHLPCVAYRLIIPQPWLKGVRVHAYDNEIVEMIGDSIKVSRLLA